VEEGAAAFYLQPTTYSGEMWNPPHSSPEVNPGVDDVVLGQATVLDACCEVWAPRYRQASFAALRAAPQAFDLAFLDVRAAFEHFLSAIGDRPFVILGHSQGALHTQNLIRTVVDKDPALADRLIAAYVVGIPVPEAFYETKLERVSACETPRQLGCIASWASFAEDFDGVARWREIARTRYADIIRQSWLRRHPVHQPPQLAGR
jgi:pimeloyl-ACP methyl ester carboxylesterase